MTDPAQAGAIETGPGPIPAGTSAGAASISGTPVTRAEAIKIAADLLAASRSAVLAGMGTDIAGARAAIALAQAIGASIDHMDADAAFANLEVMRRSGWIITTPLQVRARADTVLLVGDGLEEAWPELTSRLALNAPATLTGTPRRVFHLTSLADHPGSTLPSEREQPNPQITTIDAAANTLSALAVLRALLGNRPIALDEPAAVPLRQLAADLAQSRFGVAIWSTAALDTLAIEMLCGLIDDLNRKTRFAGLPLIPPNGAEGVTQAAAWTTGFPLRTGFAHPLPQHDPWRFDARRLIASGEADVALWISALSPTPPPWGNAVPTIALVPPGTPFSAPPAVLLEVGCPGHHHDAMLFDQSLGGIAFTPASAPTPLASVADTMTAIAAALPRC